MKVVSRFFSLVAFIFMWPLSCLWEAVYRLRRFAYNYGFFSRNTFGVPVISVGNLTFGGAGKTPFILWLGQYLSELDHKVVVLMRGYKGKLEHGHGLLQGGRQIGFNPEDFGDEALLLGRRLPRSSVIVGKKRSENLERYFDSEKPDVVLLDDGHQHLKLNRNFSIVLFDALLPLEKYKVAPVGYLREGLTALRDAQAIVLSRADQVSREKIEAIKNKIRPYAQPTVLWGEVVLKPSALFNGDYQKAMELSELKGKKVLAFAGVASPRSFFNLLESFGAQIVERRIFPDHHDFRAEEVEAMLQLARKNSLLVLTTEKDIVKLRRVSADREILFVEVDLQFTAGEEEIKQGIQAALQNKR